MLSRRRIVYTYNCKHADDDASTPAPSIVIARQFVLAYVFFWSQCFPWLSIFFSGVFGVEYMIAEAEFLGLQRSDAGQYVIRQQAFERDEWAK